MMMTSNPGVMSQQGIPPNQGQPPPQTQQQPTTSQMIPGTVNPTMSIQARQSQNDDILSNCLIQTQRLRESLQSLLNSTKQAAHIENDDQSNSTSSSSSTTTNLSSNLAHSTLRNNIDRKLSDMSKSLDQLVSLLEQYDFKLLQNQQVLINHYNELSYEKQGTLMDEWSSDTKWADKLFEIFPSIHPSNQLYRRSNSRNLNANIRSRIDGPSSTIIDRLINQFESSQQQQQQTSLTKDYSLSVQRLSDHLNIIIFSLFRSGLDIYLYLRHCTVEHIIIKPLNEKKQLINNFNNKFSTNYRALDIIAGHIRAAAVYYAPFGMQTDQALQKLLLYIYKYQTLHAQKCVNCQKHLLNGLQPTWRDFKTFECYHEECLN